MNKGQWRHVSVAQPSLLSPNKRAKASEAALSRFLRRARFSASFVMWWLPTASTVQMKNVRAMFRPASTLAAWRRTATAYEYVESLRSPWTDHCSSSLRWPAMALRPR